MSFQVIDDKPRSVLIEGRSQGMGFAFATRKGDTLTCSDAISCCKDYLSDRVYCEATGKPYSKYGWVGKKEDIFGDGPAYLIVKILGQGAKTNSTYAGMDKEIKDMEQGASAAQAIMRWMDDGIGTGGLTTVHKVGENCLVIEVPRWWTEAGYRISLYALVFRNAVLWDGNGPPMDFLEKIGNADGYYMRLAVPKLKRLMAKERPPWNWGSIYDPHNFGICGLNWHETQPKQP